MRGSDTFCWTCGSPRDGSEVAAAPDRLEVVDTRQDGSPSRGQSWAVITVIAVAVVAAVGVAVWWLVRPEDGATTVDAVTTQSAPVAAPSPDPVQPSPPAAAAATTPAVQYPTGILEPSRVTAPSTSPDSADAQGRPTSYEAANVLDADPATAWRTEGNASGASLSFTFDSAVQITQVGLINGFAKVDPYDGTDRYDQGRRILSVTWTFDSPAGPVSVPQQLTDGDRDLQLVAVPAVVAASVTLTIDSVTRPGAGGLFDRTAVSDVQFSNV